MIEGRQIKTFSSLSQKIQEDLLFGFGFGFYAFFVFE